MITNTTKQMILHLEINNDDEEQVAQVHAVITFGENGSCYIDTNILNRTAYLKDKAMTDATIKRFTDEVNSIYNE